MRSEPATLAALAGASWHWVRSPRRRRSQRSDEIGDALEFRRYYIADGAPITVNEMERLVAAHPDLYFVALNETPARGHRRRGRRTARPGRDRNRGGPFTGRGGSGQHRRTTRRPSVVPSMYWSKKRTRSRPSSTSSPARLPGAGIDRSEQRRRISLVPGRPRRHRRTRRIHDLAQQPTPERRRRPPGSKKPGPRSATRWM